MLVLVILNMGMNCGDDWRVVSKQLNTSSSSLFFMIFMKGITVQILQCHHCTHQWQSKAKLGFATCPNCMSKVRTKNEIKVKQ